MPHKRVVLRGLDGCLAVAGAVLAVRLDRSRWDGRYFADPGSSWQRGSNENTNGLLRQYFPKVSDLTPHSIDELRAVTNELNSRPLKSLNWDTPAERMTALLEAS